MRRQNLFRLSKNRDDSFISGFRQWKNALVKFKTHDTCSAHREVVMKLAHFRKGTDVARELSVAHEKGRMTAKSAMLKIITSLKYLARQNTAFRGHFDNDSNFQQLHLRANDSDQLCEWLNRDSYRWTSKEVQNEILQIMSHSILRSLRDDLHAHKNYSVIMNEICDIGIK